jgi:hypothetical protein
LLDKGGEPRSTRSHYSIYQLMFRPESSLHPHAITSVAEPHHFYAAPAPAPAPGENFDAAPAAPAPAPTLLYSKAKFLK